MAKQSILKGSTSVLDEIFIQDNSKTTGVGLTGLTSASSGLVCYRARNDDGNAGGTAISLTSTGTLGTWASGWFKEKDATNMPGVYEIGYPNAALASGSRQVTIMFQGAANMAPVLLQIELTGTDNQDAVHGGMSALPNTACTTNASLITSGNGTDQLTVSGGLASADAKKINAVSTSSVTTVNANVGTTQPENFTGTGASALVKVDVTDIATVAVSTTTAQIGVNVVNIAGSVSAGAAGYVQLDNAQPILSAPAANTVGEALYMADAARGRFGTAQGGTSNTITLDASASATDGRYVGYTVLLSGGTGGGLPGTVAQERTIVAYVGSTKVATVAQAWGTTPDNTTVFKLIAQPKVDVYCWAGDNAGIAVDGNHLPKVDVEDFGGTAGTFASGRPEVNTTKWLGGTIPAVNVTGVPKVDVVDWLGSAPNALQSGRVDSYLGATGAVTVAANTTQFAGQTITCSGGVTVPAATLASTANITAGTITTVSGNVNGNVAGSVGSISGVTFPTNFNLLVIDASGRTDLGKILGTASAGVAGYVGIDWSHVNAPTTTVGLTGTTIATSQVIASVSGAVGSVTGAVGSVTGAVGSVTGNVGGDVTGKVLGGGVSAFTAVGVQADLQTIKAQTVTCAAGVTINAIVGNATHAIVVDGSGFITFNNTTLSGSVGSVTGAVGSVTGNVGGNVIGSVGSVAGNVAGSVGSVADAGVSLTAIGDARLQYINDLFEGDEFIDTTTTPWHWVVIKKGTGGLYVGTELLRKQIKDTTGASITNATTVIGQKFQLAGSGT